MVPGGNASSNLCEPFEDADHALSILHEEPSGLLHHLRVMEAAREDRRDNDSQYGQKEIVVFSESVGVANVYGC